jgi:DNA-binding transcriptional LysR family regulator
MNANCYYFLVVAEELNISKAAKRLYISQQCLSNHIKRLEENYGVLLLNRKPRLSLTPAGEAVVRNFQRVQILEGSLQTELREIEDGRSGKIHLGIQAARAGIVIPEIITQHRKLYPGIEIIIDNGFVSDLEQQVISGKLDLFLGITPASHPLLNEIPLMKEQMYLAVTDWMLKKHFPTQFPDIKERLKKGADLKELTHLPFFAHDTRRAAR